MPIVTTHARARRIESFQKLAQMAEQGTDNPDFWEVNPITGELQERWVSICCATPGEAGIRALDTTGTGAVSLYGDFGQSDAGDLGMGNDDFSILIHLNGSATLTVRARDNDQYLRRS